MFRGVGTSAAGSNSAHPAARTLAYFHHPRYSSGMHGNTAAMQTIWEVLMAHGVDLVLSDHDHDY